MRRRRRTGFQSGRGVVIASVLALTAAGAIVSLSAFAGDSEAPVDVASMTIACPSLTDSLSAIPAAAQRAVDENSALIDTQQDIAFKKLQKLQGASGREGSITILTDLERQRRQSLARMEGAIRQVSPTVPPLQSLAACTVKVVDNPEEIIALAQQRNKGQGDPQGKGLSRKDFVDITQVPPSNDRPQPQNDASLGVFTVNCGRNENGHFNADNVIVAPGVDNAAHHMHDYVGNLSTDAQSVNASLQGAGTTCQNGDKSTHYWPVLRILDGSRERDANAPGGGQDQNLGRILSPSSVTITYKGSATGKVIGMPPFLRMLTGDAKAFAGDDKNANASWSCTGFENRQLEKKYPSCPQGSEIVRSLEFPSCWDGNNTDSANHRSHVAFPNEAGNCPNGFRAIPKLTQRITYALPPNAFFAVDSFPEQLHKPVTDHGDFINVMSNIQMNQAVACINTGRNCPA